jgi:hypothetical protein
MFEEGRPNPIGFVHASCAEAYFGTADVLGRARRLTPDLSEGDVSDLQKALSEQRPGLAKTQASEAEASSADASKTSASSGSA